MDAYDDYIVAQALPGWSKAETNAEPARHIATIVQIHALHKKVEPKMRNG